ncbi:calponin homology domain-containing protein [Boletus reticuloceps]|uniref:Calponin homology domain-containing protein n=1 Tax=Boletus reticuloceps TaxID=495285 RepID=A0A8I3A9Y4_9AGAM|nr:calponin homology domain-containing protein [Boletus reticuloceps]
MTCFRVNNFSRNMSDCENYTILLNQLKPDECSRTPLQTRDLRQCAEQVLRNTAAIGRRKYLTPASLVAGNPRLNLTFVANLFNTWPGLAPLDEQEAKDYGVVSAASHQRYDSLVWLRSSWVLRW